VAPPTDEGSRAAPGDFRLGDWIVRPSLNRIEREAEVVHLEPKVMDLLVYLARHAGTVVPKAQLIDDVWRTEFIAESALTRAIGELRRALGERAREPDYLETITKRGYRVIATVEYLGEALPAVHDEEIAIPCAVMLGEREILLGPGDNVIGRATDVAVRIDSTAVSRHHARITVGRDQAKLEDLGSKNGTRIWGREVDGPTPLCDGDRIAVGETLLIFRLLPSLAPTRTQDSP
jgi:DNA-binding winged helix-turn-helix (wHTH) protein